MCLTVLALLVTLSPGRALEAAPPGLPGPWLVDATTESGLDFVHHSARSSRHLYPETFGAGAALFDLDGDSDLDLLLLDSGSPPGAADAVAPRHLLLRNVSTGGSLRFEAIAPPSLPGLTALGACAGDVDGDGDVDLHVTGLPAGRLLLAQGGRLVPAPPGLGADDPGWSSSCVFFDADRDGDLDLYTAHYVRWSAETEKRCGGEREDFVSYCPPEAYAAEPDRLFLGDGRGHFVDASLPSGLGGAGKGLGVVAADFDRDALVDLYVANDGVANELWLARAEGGFRNVALRSGTAFAEDGRSQAGMGVDAGDLNGDGRPDLFVTNLDLETNALLLSLPSPPGIPRFRDAVHSTGLAGPSLMSLGFGTLMADLDLDGDLDLFVVNGHVIPEIDVIRPEQSWAMEDQLFENVGTAGSPRFREARDRWLPAAARRLVSRGLAGGDLDGDGDLDLIVTSNGGPARFLRNDTPRARWLGLELAATRSAPGAPGASAELQAGRRRLVLRRSGGSYLSASDTRLVFGLGDAPAEPRLHEVVVSWPSGLRELHGPLAEGRYHRVTEGRGRAPESP